MVYFPSGKLPSMRELRFLRVTLSLCAATAQSESRREEVGVLG